MADTASYPEGRWKIEVTAGEELGQSFALLDGVDLIAGRSSECSVCFSSPTISRQHCLFRVTPAGPEIEDLGAKKPAKINGTVLQAGQKIKLCHGDRICIGGKRGVEIILIDTSVGQFPSRLVKVAETQCNAADNETIAVADESGLQEPEHDATLCTSVGGMTNLAVDEDATAFMDPDKTVFLDRSKTLPPGSEDEADLDLSHDAATGYLPVEEVKEILDGSGRRKKRLLLFAAIGVGAIFFLSIMGKSGEDGKTKDVKHKLYQGSFFTCELPSSWTVGSKGAVVTMRPKASLLKKEGIALLRYSNEKCRWWTYEKNIPEMAGMVTKQLPFLEKIKNWVPVLQSEQPQLQLYRLYETALPYTVFEGLDEHTNRVAVARFYLGGDTAFLSVIWPGSESKKKSQEIWKGLDVQGAVADIDRRVVYPSKEWEKWTVADISKQLTDAGKWYAKADIAEGNTWRAYQIMHEVHTWFSLQPDELPEMDAIRDKAWVLSCKVVKRLDDLFAELQKDVTTALLAGDKDKVNYFTSMIQREIPHKNDYRWLWAEKKKNALSK